jgi:hypothetical protein
MSESKNFSIPKEAEVVYSDNSYEVRHCDLYGKKPKTGVLTDDEQTRGVVINKTEEKSPVVCRTFPNTRDFIETFPENVNDYCWTLAREMNSLSLFCDENTFHLKTTKKMDAFRSSWIDEYSFGRIFVQALEGFDGTNPFLVENIEQKIKAISISSSSTSDSSSSSSDISSSRHSSSSSSTFGTIGRNDKDKKISNDGGTTFKEEKINSKEQEKKENGAVMDYLTSKLDKSRTYTFSIPFTGFNSLICTPPQKPEFYYCGSFSKDGKNFISAYDEKDTFLSSLPKQDVLVFKDTEELVSFVKNLPKTEGQGVIGVQKTNVTPIVVKVYNEEYKKEYDKRMKQNELLNEYLKIRTDELKRQNFFREYPELIPIIEEYDSIIESISEQIFDIYQAKFVKKMETPTVHPLIWKIMRDLHKWHIQGMKDIQNEEEKRVLPLANRRRKVSSANIVSQDSVYEKIDTLAANDMRRLILDYIRSNPQIVHHVHNNHI